MPIALLAPKPVLIRFLSEFAGPATETLLFSASDDGSGKPPTYSQTPQTKSTSVTREGGRVAFRLPFDPPSVVIEGDKMTATAENLFIDYWERVH
jgi:hypothetical protein